jgi:alkylhydroperoxidase family enzyme
LSALARRLIEHRGHVDDGDLRHFLAAGFERTQVLEAIAVVAASTITNYVGSVARPPLETSFQPHAWVA